ncbi:PRC-barrel domain-containing protein [Paracoccus aerius]|uniref:PRC-barrel domain-containing protein n=1 Tax=Paracoccus aerius TaxID=1915382 RepID=A0ABS1S9N7_9RHOB|nr:PRC-barrel domain-containing protein [Paracoccus aerius]MBL3674422.1 PRC-barrel domain-containing protein [Paracoccus aerius]GHG26199.1 hypothetical protein GCM10017322_25700 [Paracoccus aerius]
MTKLLASTALVAMLAAPAAIAQTATTAPATTEAPMTDATTTAPADATTTTTMPADGTTAAMPAGGAMADEGFGYTAMAGDMSAETFMGKRLYASEAEVDVNAAYTEVDQDWDDIGEISDLVIGQDGMVKAVLTDIGGFLGLGERTVAVSMDDLQVIRDGDSEDEYFIVFTANRAALENAPEFEWMDE